MTDTASRVSKSIKLLDDLAGKVSFIPVDWRDKIDKDTLDMNSARYCILGQLWGARKGSSFDGYDRALEVIENTTEYSNVSWSDDFCFADGDSEWIEQLSFGSEDDSRFTVGDVWTDESGCCEYTIKGVLDIDGIVHVVVIEDPSGTPILRKASSLYKFSLKPKIRFTKGQWLKADGFTARFIYINDEAVIRVDGSQIGWSNLAYFEDEYGKLTVDFGSAEFYFNDLWNRK